MIIHLNRYEFRTFELQQKHFEKLVLITARIQNLEFETNKTKGA